MALFGKNNLPGLEGNPVSSGNPDSKNESEYTPPRPIKDNITNYRVHGSGIKQPGGIISRFLKSIISYRKYYVINKRITTNSPETENIRRLDMDSIEKIASFLKISKNSKEYKNIIDCFADGCECYSLIENNLMALTWVYRKRYRIEGGKKVLEIKADEALITDTVISESNDCSKTILLEDFVASSINQKGIKPLIFARHDNNELPVYTIRQGRILGLAFTRISANPIFSPLSFR